MITNETVIELCEAIQDTWKKLEYIEDCSEKYYCLFCVNESKHSFDDITHENQCVVLKADQIREELKENILHITKWVKR
jgi:hypothetical protein